MDGSKRNGLHEIPRTRGLAFFHRAFTKSRDESQNSSRIRDENWIFHRDRDETS